MPAKTETNPHRAWENQILQFNETCFSGSEPSRHDVRERARLAQDAHIVIILSLWRILRHLSLGLISWCCSTCLSRARCTLFWLVYWRGRASQNDIDVYKYAEESLSRSCHIYASNWPDWRAVLGRLISLYKFLKFWTMTLKVWCWDAGCNFTQL